MSQILIFLIFKNLNYISNKDKLYDQTFLNLFPSINGEIYVQRGPKVWKVYEQLNKF